jgi:hypothetical protein
MKIAGKFSRRKTKRFLHMLDANVQVDSMSAEERGRHNFERMLRAFLQPSTSALVRSLNACAHAG